jgi:hypothetical protein
MPWIPLAFIITKNAQSSSTFPLSVLSRTTGPRVLVIAVSTTFPSILFHLFHRFHLFNLFHLASSRKDWSIVIQRKTTSCIRNRVKDLADANGNEGHDLQGVSRRGGQRKRSERLWSLSLIQEVSWCFLNVPSSKCQEEENCNLVYFCFDFF